MTTLIRTAGRAALLTGAVTLSVVALPGIAQADPGTIKVHSPGTAFDVRANEPKQACAFRISAFGATAGETYRVTFEPQGGANVRGEPTTASDTYTADENVSKNGRTADGRTGLFNQDLNNLELEDGQYRVTATNVEDPGDRKSKVFKVDCPAPGAATPTPTPDVGGGGLPDDPDLGGEGNPDDEGESPVGGVATGGGGLAGPTSTDTTIPLLLTVGAGLALAAGSLRRRSE